MVLLRLCICFVRFRVDSLSNYFSGLKEQEKRFKSLESQVTHCSLLSSPTHVCFIYCLDCTISTSWWRCSWHEVLTSPIIFFMIQKQRGRLCPVISSVSLSCFVGPTIPISTYSCGQARVNTCLVICFLHLPFPLNWYLWRGLYSHIFAGTGLKLKSVLPDR